MRLQWRVFRRVFGLLSLLIVSVCVTAAVFSLREHREIVRNSFRAQALFLADQVERLVLWDDRVALKTLLTRFVDEQSVVAYAFVKKTGAPYVYTQPAGVPRSLLDMRPEAQSVSLKSWESSASEVYYDIAAPLRQGEAVLHIGLERREIDIESFAKVWAITLLGGGALLIGLALAGVTAVVTTKEVNEMTDALRFSEERVRLLLSSAAEGVFGIDLSGSCTFINPAAQRMLGFEDDDTVLGQNMHNLIHHTAADGSPCPYESCRIRISAHSDEPVHLDEEVLWRRNGASFPAEIWSHPIEKDGASVGAVVTFVDITERKESENERNRLQQQLFDARKMEALGQLAGGIAHDFNNLLSPIILITEVLLDDHPSEDEEAKHLNDVLMAARRARELVHQILSYSRPEEREKVRVDFATLVADVVSLVRPSLPGGVSLEQAIEPELPTILGDFTEIHQLILNLATNAIQAMEETGGRLEIGLHRGQILEPQTYRRGTLHPGEYVVLRISDSGHGMTEETRRRIFEPFFTTKKGTDGAGLGLAIADRIVTGHGGMITVASGIGEGTTFEVYFPADTELDESAPAEQVVPA